MVAWYAVVLGVVVAVVGSVVGVVIPGIGQLGAVVLGGAVAGYLVGSLRGGLWHGFLTGTIPALALAGVFAIGIVIMDLGLRPFGPILALMGFDSLGSFFTVSAYGPLIAIVVAPLAVAGCAGGVLGGAVGRL